MAWILATALGVAAVPVSRPLQVPASADSSEACFDKDGITTLASGADTDATVVASERAAGLCRSSELAFHEGNHDQATKLAYEALDVPGGGVRPLEHACWLFSVVGHDAEAIQSLKRLADFRPLSDVELLQLSGFLLRGQKIDEAVSAYREAAARPGVTAQTLTQCGVLANVCGQPEEAIRFLVDAVRENPRDALIYRQMSAAYQALGQMLTAAKLARWAHKLDSSNVEYVANVAALLTQLDEMDAAINFLSENEFTRQDARLSVMLSAILAKRGDLDAALEVVTNAVVVDPNSREARMHRGGILCQLGQFDVAAEEFALIVRQHGDDIEATRARFAALTEAGLYSEATPLGGRLVGANPNDAEIGRTLQHILTRRFVQGVLSPEESGVTLHALKSGAAAIRNRVEKTFSSAVATQVRIIAALVLRETKTRFGRERLGYAWALLEPIAHIALLSLVIGSMAHGMPPIGQSFVVFYFSGIIPYHLVTHTGSQLSSAVAANRSLLQLSLVTPNDVLIGRALLEITTELVVAIILLGMFLAVGLNAQPDNYLKVAGAFGIMGVLGWGLGTINCVIECFIPSWEKLWGNIIRIMYFSSGIFYIPSSMPSVIRDILVWNPVLQGIEFYRSGWFSGYSPPWIDLSYLMIVTGFIFVVGQIMERALRRQMMEPE